MTDPRLDELCINSMRFLAVDIGRSAIFIHHGVRANEHDRFVAV